MRRGKHRKFGREKKQREALYKSLATALIEHGKIKTTEAKAKSLSRHFDKLVTVAKKQTLASRRLLQADLGDKAIRKLITDVVPTFADRKGGYSRIVRLGQRKSDGSLMAVVELTK